MVYASSTSTTAEGGTLSRKAWSSLAPTIVPVGLFGLQTYTRPVFASHAAAMAGRSCRKSEVWGTLTASARVTRAYSRTASKVGSAATILLPGPRNAESAMRRTSLEPHPRTTCSGRTPWWRATVACISSCLAKG